MNGGSKQREGVKGGSGGRKWKEGGGGRRGGQNEWRGFLLMFNVNCCQSLTGASIDQVLVHMQICCNTNTN